MFLKRDSCSGGGGGVEGSMVEECVRAYLLLDAVPAVARKVHEVKHGRLQVRQRSDGLHLNGGGLLKGLVQHSGGVNHLPGHLTVVCVSKVERLGCECVGLHVNIGACHLVHEGGLSDVGETADEECTCVRVNRGQTTQMLTHLFQVSKRVVKLFQQGCHST